MISIKKVSPWWWQNKLAGLSIMGTGQLPLDCVVSALLVNVKNRARDCFIESYIIVDIHNSPWQVAKVLTKTSLDVI